jgi:hypothetical protein
VQRLAAILVGVAFVLGMKFYNKSSANKEVKAHLMALCEGDAGCQTAVGTHFDGCFESAYKMGGRRSSSRLESEQLVLCINSRAGKPHFAYAQAAK